MLFESLAGSYRERAIAVVLTGTGTDGNMGVRAVKKRGGTVIAQDEKSSEFFGMPGAAIHTGNVDFILALEEFMSLDIGLPFDEVKKGIRSCLAGETGYEETVLEAVNRRGKRIQCRVTWSRLHDKNDNPGVILLMEESD